MTDFTRRIEFVAAYNKTNPDPKKDYGVHGVDCVFTLTKNGKGIDFTIYTNWMLPADQAATDERRPDPRFPYMFHKPMAAGVNYHDTKPHYEGQPKRAGCSITGGDCYCDSSYTTGEEIMTALREGGGEGLWKKMEALYADWLESEEPA